MKVSFTADITGTVSADGYNGGVTGTATLSYLAVNKADMFAFADKVNTADNLFAGTTVELANDIDLENDAWTPIGTSNVSNNAKNSFQGVFDGKGYTISGLNVSSAKQLSDVGLFGTIYHTGTVKNLTVDGSLQANVSPIGELYMGGIVAFNDGGTVQNCASNVTITVADNVNSGSNTSIGGLVGWNVFSDAGFVPLIENCSAHGDITVGDTAGGRSVAVGGLVGLSDGGTIQNSFAAGTVKSNCDSDASSRYFGGLIGRGANMGEVENCYATGDVTGDQYTHAGGIAGILDSSCSLTSCYATGEVIGNRAGGIAGGYAASDSIYKCIALNPSVERSGSDEARRVAYISVNGELLSSENAAYSGMLNSDDTTVWDVPNDIEGQRNGADMTRVEICSDGTLGGRFTAAGGWTTENGKLPGFGAAVDMPPHLKAVKVEITGVTANSNLIYSQTAKDVDATQASAGAASTANLSYEYAGARFTAPTRLPPRTRATIPVRSR